MTTSELRRAYVWTWLPQSAEPVVAGLLEQTPGQRDRLRFAYARSYLARADSLSLYGPELPLRSGWIAPGAGLPMAGCLRDAYPDAWGQRVILNRLAGARGASAQVEALDRFSYLLQSGSNRFGAIDFQSDPDVFAPREDTADLDTLIDAVDQVEAGAVLPAAVADALVAGTSIGGARPKLLIRQGGDQFIAKLSTSTDPYPVVNAEAAAMELARMVGIAAADSRVTRAAGRELLLVRRFDRGAGGTRAHVVSALTMLGLDEMVARYATYPGLLDVLRSHAVDAGAIGAELFGRIAFNIAVGNIDDHARNHAAFWDGDRLRLTPAYDLCPQVRSGETAFQAMAYGRDGQRRSNFADLAGVAGEYGLSAAQARERIAGIIEGIERSWPEAADRGRLTAADRQLLWRRQILNPGVMHGWVG